MKKHCKQCGDNINIEVIDMGHDINIMTDDYDNCITITKDEAEFVLKELKKILSTPKPLRRIK